MRKDTEMALHCPYCDEYVVVGTPEDARNEVTIHMNIHHARQLATFGRIGEVLKEDGANPKMNTCPVCHKEFPKSRQGADDYYGHLQHSCFEGLRMMLDQFGKEYDLKEKGYKL